MTIEALAKNPESKNSILFIYSDMAKNKEALPGVIKVRQHLHDIKKKNWFKVVIIIEQSENQGLAKSIINGVTEIINQYERIIVLEDDCVVSEYFLNYMNSALDYFKDRAHIGSISGYTPLINKLMAFEPDIFCVPRSCSLCWGTWKHIWNDVSWDMRDYKENRYNYLLIRRVNACGNDRFYRYIRQYKYDVNSWSVRFGVHLVKNNLNTVYPQFSYCMNIGNDGTGTHDSAGKCELSNVEFSKAIPYPTMCDIVPDINKIKAYHRIYRDSYIRSIYRTIYVYGGEKLIDLFKIKSKR